MATERVTAGSIRRVAVACALAGAATPGCGSSSRSDWEPSGGTPDAGHDTGTSASDAGPGADVAGGDDAAAGACAEYLSGTGPVSQWVYADPTGKLAYKPL